MYRRHYGICRPAIKKIERPLYLYYVKTDAGIMLIFAHSGMDASDIARATLAARGYDADGPITFSRPYDISHGMAGIVSSTSRRPAFTGVGSEI